MTASFQIRISLVPEHPAAYPSALDRIQGAFAEHLIVDRGIETNEAKRQAADIFGREMSIHRANAQDFMSIRNYGRLVGFLWKTERTTDEGLTWHILYIETLPPFRGRGIANAAMTELIEWARKAGVSAITLNVSPRNKPALGLYCRLGFVAQRGGWVLPLAPRID